MRVRGRGCADGSATRQGTGASACAGATHMERDGLAAHFEAGRHAKEPCQIGTAHGSPISRGDVSQVALRDAAGEGRPHIGALADGDVLLTERVDAQMWPDHAAALARRVRSALDPKTVAAVMTSCERTDAPQRLRGRLLHGSSWRAEARRRRDQAVGNKEAHAKHRAHAVHQPRAANGKEHAASTSTE